MSAQTMKVRTFGNRVEKMNNPEGNTSESKLIEILGENGTVLYSLEVNERGGLEITAEDMSRMPGAPVEDTLDNVLGTRATFGNVIEVFRFKRD